uniref:Disease resistance protein At4g27190-like leucine-rich repeats domain-containing protein n=1 Tax=Triticum urartu TaxID=4572 RepID=A0A8R7PP13_TRIUA
MDNLAYFCQGMEDLTSFSCLMHLLLDCCPKLNFLFPSSLRLPNLRSLQIRFCDSLERVFDESVAAEHALPRLQSLQLWELPELSCICGRVLPSLKDLKVKGCAKLKGIPIGVTENNPFFATIIGETQWWNDLVWVDGSIKRWILFRNWGPLLPHFATEG